MINIASFILVRIIPKTLEHRSYFPSPKHNKNNSYYFMWLKISKKTHSNNYTPLGISNAIISKNEALTDAEGVSSLTEGEISLEWDHSTPILDKVETELCLSNF